MHSKLGGEAQNVTAPPKTVLQRGILNGFQSINR
jgi:hypothetical protein